MRRIILLSFLLFSGCTGIEVIKDEYRNTKYAELQLRNTSDGVVDGLLGRRRFQSIVFKRLIDSSNKETLSARISVSLGSSDEPLSERLFFKINDQVFELRLENLTTSNETQSGVYQNQATGQTRAYSYSVQEGKGTVVLTAEIREALLRSSSFQVRSYLGDRPVTFTYSGLDVAKLHHLLNYEFD